MQTTVVEILESVSNARGFIEKSKILSSNHDNEVIKEILRLTNDPFITFNVVKIPSTNERNHVKEEEVRWQQFFDAATICASRRKTGKDAINLMQNAFAKATECEEQWMRKILQKHLNVGVSTKSINKIFPGLIRTFDVQLAKKFDEKRVHDIEKVAVEPKYDGIRCIAIVDKNEVEMFARSGKQIVNFIDTVGSDLICLGDGVYDGEIMSEDFTELMRQVYRKKNAKVSDVSYVIFDYLPIKEWKSKMSKMTCEDRYNVLLSREPRQHKFLSLAPRYYITPDKILDYHKAFEGLGYEGTMIKSIDAPYKFNRGYEVMKLKSFLDADCEVIRIEAGSGKFKETTGSLVVDFNGVEVGIGSGLSEKERAAIWAAPNEYIGMTVEIRYQEVTNDGSLRFPTFVCFRNDR